VRAVELDVRRPKPRRPGAGVWFAGAAMGLPLRLLTRERWRGMGHVPATGPVIVVANHVSSVDACALAVWVYAGAGRSPRFMAKASLWRVPVVRQVFRSARQIPVSRGAADASAALQPAVAALSQGEVIVLFPEGGITRDPDRWPMRARTGAGRLALLSGAPVVPVGQWGSDALLHRGWWRRPVASIQAGPPVELGDLVVRAGGGLDEDLLRAATDRIMDAIAALVAGLRGGHPPALPYDPRAAAPPPPT